MSRRNLTICLALSSLLAMGCECGHHDDASEDEHTSEGAHEGESESPTEEHAEPAHPVGPLGWTAVVESETGDDEYVEHRLLMWRTGPATGERDEAMNELGHFSNWAGVYTLYVASEAPVDEADPQPLTLLGVRGSCETTATRTLHLRVTFDPHHGDAEERLYDALEFEGCPGPWAFGASGSVPLVELSTRTMETPPEEVMAVVRDREDQITEESGDEPMRVVGREIPQLHVWVLSGWETYVVRGSTIVTHTEQNAIGAVTIGDRTMLLMRGDDGPELRIPGDDRLESVNPDADPNASEAPAHAPAHPDPEHP